LRELLDINLDQEVESFFKEYPVLQVISGSYVRPFIGTTRIQIADAPKAFNGSSLNSAAQMAWELRELLRDHHSDKARAKFRDEAVAPFLKD